MLGSFTKAISLFLHISRVSYTNRKVLAFGMYSLIVYCRGRRVRESKFIVLTYQKSCPGWTYFWNALFSYNNINLFIKGEPSWPNNQLWKATLPNTVSVGIESGSDKTIQTVSVDYAYPQFRFLELWNYVKYIPIIFDFRKAHVFHCVSHFSLMKDEDIGIWGRAYST